MWASDYYLGTRLYNIASGHLTHSLHVGANSKACFVQSQDLILLDRDGSIYAFSLCDMKLVSVVRGNLIATCPVCDRVLVYRTSRSRKRVSIVLLSADLSEESVVCELNGFGVVCGCFCGNHVALALAGGESFWIIDLASKDLKLIEEAVGGYPMGLFNVKSSDSCIVWVASKKNINSGYVLTYSYSLRNIQFALEHSWGKMLYIDGNKILFGCNGEDEVVSML